MRTGLIILAFVGLLAASCGDSREQISCVGSYALSGVEGAQFSALTGSNSMDMCIDMRMDAEEAKTASCKGGFRLQRKSCKASEYSLSCDISQDFPNSNVSITELHLLKGADLSAFNSDQREQFCSKLKEQTNL